MDQSTENIELKIEYRIFCENYIYDWNATRAYRVAYPESSIPAAASSSYELLRKPEIKQYITAIQADLEKLAGISRLQIILNHLKIVNCSITNFHNTWITRKEFDQVSEDDKYAIQQIEYQTRMESNPIADGPAIQVDFVKLKLYDRQKSMDALNKMLGYDEAKKIAVQFGEKQVFKIGNQEISF